MRWEDEDSGTWLGLVCGSSTVRVTASKPEMWGVVGDGKICSFSPQSGNIFCRVPTLSRDTLSVLSRMKRLAIRRRPQSAGPRNAKGVIKRIALWRRLQAAGPWASIWKQGLQGVSNTKNSVVLTNVSLLTTLNLWSWRLTICCFQHHRNKQTVCFVPPVS